VHLFNKMTGFVNENLRDRKEEKPKTEIDGSIDDTNKIKG